MQSSRREAGFSQNLIFISLQNDTFLVGREINLRLGTFVVNKIRLPESLQCSD